MVPPQITFRELSHFLAVVCQGGFVRASEALHVSQPSVSQSVQSLETKLGTQLIVRGRKAIALTEKGEVLRRYAERTLREEMSLRDIMGRDSQGLEGRLRVTVPPALSSVCFPAIIESFCREHPGVMLEIDESPSEKLMPRLRGGQTEIAALIVPGGEEALHFYPLGRDHLCLVVPDAHDLAERRSCALSEIIQERVALLREDFKINRFILQAYTGHGAKPRVVGRTGDIHLLMAMVRSGLGLGIIPSALCRGVWMEGVRALHLHLPVMGFDWALATRRDHGLSPAGEAWRKTCLEHFTHSILPEENLLEEGSSRERPSQVSVQKERP